MNELNKLIEQYETENPGEKAYHSYRMGHIPDRPNPRFMEWMAKLASRPTCSKNERAFLDEIKDKFMVHNGTIVSKNRMAEGEYVYLYQSDFTKSNLKELVNEQ